MGGGTVDLRTRDGLLAKLAKKYGISRECAARSVENPGGLPLAGGARPRPTSPRSSQDSRLGVIFGACVPCCGSLAQPVRTWRERRSPRPPEWGSASDRSGEKDRKKDSSSCVIRPSPVRGVLASVFRPRPDSQPRATSLAHDRIVVPAPLAHEMTSALRAAPGFAPGAVPAPAALGSEHHTPSCHGAGALSSLRGRTLDARASPW